MTLFFFGMSVQPFFFKLSINEVNMRVFFVMTLKIKGDLLECIFNVIFVYSHMRTCIDVAVAFLLYQ